MSGRQPVASGEEDLAALQERIGEARRSIVAIRTGALAATGWVALPNGVVLTSQKAIGYPAEVSLDLDDGRTLPGRVIAVDVARDAALLLPLESPRAPPLPARPLPEPRLGEAVTALSHVPGQGLRLAWGRICQLQRGEEALPRFAINTPAPLGAPVLDSDGRALGIVTAPPPGRGAEAGWSTALAIGSLQAFLAAADRAAHDLRERVPIYRCPRCDEPFDVENDRCSACGRPLPHAFPSSDACARAERLLRQSLTAVGVTANRVRIGPRAWRLSQRPFTATHATQVDVEIDEEGSLFTIRAPVVGVPVTNHEPFYRFLLTMNDQTTGDFRISIADDVASVSCVESVDGCSEPELARRIEEIVQVADEYRRALTDFDVEPRYHALRRS